MNDHRPHFTHIDGEDKLKGLNISMMDQVRIKYEMTHPSWAKTTHLGNRAEMNLAEMNRAELTRPNGNRTEKSRILTRPQGIR